MIAEILNRDVLLSQVAILKESLSTQPSEQDKENKNNISSKELLAALKGAEKKEKAHSSSQASFEPPSGDRRGHEVRALDDYSFFSRDPVLSMLQTILEEDAIKGIRLEQLELKTVPVERRGGVRGGDEGMPMVTDQTFGYDPTRARMTDLRLFERYSITDIGWVQSKLAEGLRMFRGKHAFNPNPAKPVTISNRVQLIVVGDWGSGLPRAVAVSDQMLTKVDDALKNKIAVHVVHLGDVYYSGWDHEYKSRFLPYWPVQKTRRKVVGSWCLNGNHDMYSGGHGYFDVALADERFALWQKDDKGKPTSFFSLVNSNWKILGLDTSWEEGGLADPQPEWLRDELASAGNRKTLLLSHHQPFSVYESAPKELSEKTGPILKKYPVTSWFWGHEHRCMLFRPYANVKFGRCTGDGGVPVYQWHNEKTRYKNPGSYEHRRFMPRGLERWAYMGFAVLDFVGEKIHVSYRDENGYEHKSETIE